MSNILTQFIAANGNRPIAEWPSNIERFAQIVGLPLKQRYMDPSEREEWHGKLTFHPYYDIRGELIRVVTLEDACTGGVSFGGTKITEVLSDPTSTDFIVGDGPEPDSDLSIVELMAVNRTWQFSHSFYVADKGTGLHIDEAVLFRYLSETAREVPLMERDVGVTNGRTFLFLGREVLIHINIDDSFPVKQDRETVHMATLHTALAHTEDFDIDKAWDLSYEIAQRLSQVSKVHVNNAIAEQKSLEVAVEPSVSYWKRFLKGMHRK